MNSDFLTETSDSAVASCADATATIVDDDDKTGGREGGRIRLERRELLILLASSVSPPPTSLLSCGDPNGLPKGVDGGRTEGGSGTAVDVVRGGGRGGGGDDSANGLPAPEARRFSDDGPKGLPAPEEFLRIDERLLGKV